MIGTSSKKHITVGELHIESLEGETVLESMERAGIEAHYNCREGFCGVCRTKLLKGEVHYQLDPLAFIDDDEILSCCTRPKSDIHIKVEY